MDLLTTTLGMSERLACTAVGLARSTYCRLPQAQSPADPDAAVRPWLRSYAGRHPGHGFRRAWTTLGYDEHRAVNKKKIHRLRREEGLQVKITSMIDEHTRESLLTIVERSITGEISSTSCRRCSLRLVVRRRCCSSTTVRR